MDMIAQQAPAVGLDKAACSCSWRGASIDADNHVGSLPDPIEQLDRALSLLCNILDGEVSRSRDGHVLMVVPAEIVDAATAMADAWNKLAMDEYEDEN
jgi:hypothetical protein